MARHDKNILAVIPARGGSKSIPNKNIREINGKTLIAHAAQCAQALQWIDAIILSSDNEEYCAHAQTLNIDVPFIRPIELSTDHTKSIDMWQHAWLNSEEYYNTTFDISVLLEPTSPLRTAEDIKDSVDLLVNNKHAYSVATVSKTPGHYTPHKTLKINDSGNIEPYLKDGIQYSIRQQIPNYYHRNGICYATTRESLIENNNLMQEKCLALIIHRPIVNIDEEIDLKLAEVLMAG